MKKEASTSARLDDSSEVDRQTIPARRADITPRGVHTEKSENSSANLTDLLAVWHLWLRTQQPATRNAWNNDYMIMLSHELRNSLSTIRTATGILSLDTSVLTAAKVRSLIERQVTQMTRLVADMMDLSRVRIGQLELHCERVDMCAVAARALETVEFTMVMRGHKVKASFPDNGPVWLRGDPVRLEEVFVNLLLNAAKYTDCGGDIRLSVERHDCEGVVRIRDTGIGIERGALPHVFDLFFRADRSPRRAEPGLGVGLALVRSLVERHGGLVTAESAGPGRGSEFVVRLPTSGE
ncbi:MAG TPA: HAMP domain-containing sensor histidine kinase [Steroidobacteraceae bacterium]